LSVVVVVQLSPPTSWQPEDEAAYLFEDPQDSRIEQLFDMADENGGVATVMVLPVKPVPEF
jgi:hypothetical protein